MLPLPPRRLVIGLGNPGAEHEGTRHNVGFRVLDRLARAADTFFEGSRAPEGYDGPRNFAWARWREPPALLVEPLTWMNRSGDAVLPLVAWAGLGPEDLLVVYDDMDLPTGALRLRPGGGAGGQKGMRSILTSLATESVPRLRVGVGRPPTDAVRHVLSGFDPDEQRRIDEAADEACDAIRLWLETGDLERCMTRFHSRWRSASARADGAPDESARRERKEDE